MEAHGVQLEVGRAQSDLGPQVTQSKDYRRTLLVPMGAVASPSEKRRPSTTERTTNNVLSRAPARTRHPVRDPHLDPRTIPVPVPAPIGFVYGRTRDPTPAALARMHKYRSRTRVLGPR